MKFRILEDISHASPSVNEQCFTDVHWCWPPLILSSKALGRDWYFAAFSHVLPPLWRWRSYTSWVHCNYTVLLPTYHEMIELNVLRHDWIIPKIDKRGKMNNSESWKSRIFMFKCLFSQNYWLNVTTFYCIEYIRSKSPSVPNFVRIRWVVLLLRD